MKGCGKAGTSDSNRKAESLSPVAKSEGLSSDNDDSPIMGGRN